jgi:uncharacterized protein
MSSLTANFLKIPMLRSAVLTFKGFLMLSFPKLLAEPGEIPFTFQGKVGLLEAVCLVPEIQQTNKIAILGHPHPLHGGTMSNKVVTTLARAFNEVGIPSIRFNFRGVGASTGEHDHGVGESEDMSLLITQIQAQLPDIQWILAGFSFGSYVTYRAALKHTPCLLISIAPPIERYDYIRSPACPWIIIQGDADEVVHAPGVVDFAKFHQPPLEVIQFEGAGHFFHGKLLLLRQAIEDVVQKLV